MSLQSSLVFEKTLRDESTLAQLVQQMCLSLGKDSILLLSGDLGVGKTTTSRYLCQQFGIFQAQSPTYAIHQHYENTLITIDHFDLYRIQSEDDLESTGFWDLINTSRGLVIIEWHEKLTNQNWLLAEIKNRKIFGLKIKLHTAYREFSFFELQEIR